MQVFTGKQYLMIDISNHFGLDKEPYADRISWVEQHEDDLEDLMNLADKPFEYLAAVMAYRDTQQGIPTGHLVGFDSCASGPALMAALVGCKETARNTGLIGNERKDLYTECTAAMSMILGSNISTDRKLVKKAQMPYFFGSEEKPKELFGDGTPEIYAFHKANRQVAPGACELRDILIAAWNPWALSHDWILPDGFTVHCPVVQTNETNIEIDELDHATISFQHKINAGTPTGLSNAANLIHALDGMIVREMCRRCHYDEQQLKGVRDAIVTHFILNKEPFIGNNRIEALAVDSAFYSIVAVEDITGSTVYSFSKEYLKRILNLIDRTLQHKSFPLITIHDCFKAHANNMDVVRQIYIDIMAEIAESNILEFTLSQLKGKHVPVTKYSDDLADLIRASEYALS